MSYQLQTSPLGASVFDTRPLYVVTWVVNSSGTFRLPAQKLEKVLPRKMQKMREMMAKLQKQMPKEFLNIDGMKNDKVVDSLQESESQLSSIEDLLEQDKLDEALERLDELANSLDEMAQQLEQDRDELHQETNPELDKALSELMDSTRDLMMSQADLQRDTEAQQAAIDEATAEVIKARQKLLEELKEKVGEVDRIERSLETREMSYLDRIRGDARKAITDLERALDAAILEEGIDAAQRGARELQLAPFALQRADLARAPLELFLAVVCSSLGIRQPRGRLRIILRSVQQKCLELVSLPGQARDGLLRVRESPLGVRAGGAARQARLLDRPSKLVVLVP